MYRDKLLKLLTKYHCCYCEECDYKDHITDFVKQYDNCFDRNLSVGHVTASAWVLNHNKQKALLMLHSKLNIWMQPGGHCDDDEDIIQAALREATEESGINNLDVISEEIFDLDIHYIPATLNEKAHYHYDIRFLLQAKEPAKLVKNNEAKEMIWINQVYSNLPTYDRSIVRMFDKWVRLSA